MKRKPDNNLTIFDEMNFSLQEKLKQADARLQEACEKLEAEREAFDNCHFINEKHEYEHDVQYAQRMVKEAEIARDEILRQIQNLEN